MKSSGRCLVLVLLPVFLVAHQAAGQNPRELEQGFRQSLHEQTELQEQVDAWSAEKQKLLHQILDLKVKKQWLLYQNAQHQGYIHQKKTSIAAIQDRVQQVLSLRMQLEPYLEQVAAELDRRVTDSPAFLPLERRERMDFLQKSLKAYGPDMSEKLRRVLEALQIEAEYGTDIEVGERQLRLDGETTRVNSLRLGRVALLAVTPDGRHAWMRDAESRTWTRLPAHEAGAIQKTMDIVEQKRSAELIALPLGTPIKLKIED